MAKVDFKDLERLAGKVDKLTGNAANQLSEASVKELATRLLQKVVDRTPVGKYPQGSGKTGGTLRRGWTVGEVAKTAGGWTVEVVNPVEYAQSVEFGHRTRNHKGWVPGRFMMALSEQELEKDTPRILENKLDRFLKGGFQ